MLQPRALCCVQAWISPLQLGELHGPPTYAAGAEKGMLTRISSGSALRHLATGPLSRSGSCSILLCSAVLLKLTQVRQQLQQRCAHSLAWRPMRGSDFFLRHLRLLCVQPHLSLECSKQYLNRPVGACLLNSPCTEPMQYTVWQLSSAMQLSLCCLMLAALCCIPACHDRATCRSWAGQSRQSAP